MLCERGKKFLDLVNKQSLEVQCCSEKKIKFFLKHQTNDCLADSVMRKKKKLSLFCIQKHCLCRVLVEERRNYILFLNFVFKQALAVEC